MRVHVQRRTNARRVMNLQKSHLIAFDQRFDEQVTAIHRLAFDRFYDDALDVRVPGQYHRLLLSDPLWSGAGLQINEYLTLSAPAGLVKALPRTTSTLSRNFAQTDDLPRSSAMSLNL